MILRRLLIVGAGGHGVSLYDVAIAAGYRVLGFVDDAGSGTSLVDLPATDFDLAAYASGGGLLAVAIGDNSSRERVWNESFPGASVDQFPTLVHPSASVSSRAQVGPGCVIHPGVVIGPLATIGAFCILNSSSVLEHECTMGDFASLAPGSIVGGRSTIGARSAVGLGAVIKHGVSVGGDTVVGANSYVHFDLDDRVVAFGSPARVMRVREPREPYL